jgi:hypothetical protein
MAGGRRRGKKSRASRKMRGGNFYGAAVDPQIGSAGLARPSVENVAADSATGRLIPNNAELNATQLGGRRRRRTSKKTRKGGKHRRGHKSRKMRGGMSVGQVGYGFTGTGAAGLADAVGYNANVGGAPTGPDGVARV